VSKTVLLGLTATSLIALAAGGVLADTKPAAVSPNHANLTTTIQLAQHADPSHSSGGMGQSGAGQSGMGQGGMGSGGMMGMDKMMGVMGIAPGAGTSMAMPSALPGFPGASHLYHVGSTDFFLDYADKLGLSVEQKSGLNAIKQRALSAQATTQRKTAEAEEALWTLTAAEQPDAAAIESKVREIEKLRSEQRLTFIRAVGDAGKLLTADQQKMVHGLMPMPADAPMTRPMK
jgi:Spy/CpxP family protein refolding chaperone